MTWSPRNETSSSKEGCLKFVQEFQEIAGFNPLTSSYTGELYYVDGFDEEKNTVFEFYGCYFHGCPRCFKRHRDVRRTCYKDRTVHEVYGATQKKAEMLRRAGYTMKEKWKCEFKEQKKTNPQLQTLKQSLGRILNM